MQKQHARWRNTTNKRTWKRPRLINDYNEEDMILEKGNTKRIIYLCNKIEATKLYNHIEDISYHLAKIIVGTSVFWCYVSVFIYTILLQYSKFSTFTQYSWYGYSSLQYILIFRNLQFSTKNPQTKACIFRFLLFHVLISDPH